MTKDKRRAKRISVELPVTVYLFNNKGKTRMGSSMTGHIKDFSPIGVALTVATILIDGQHLFYGCHDNHDIVLVLEFELGDRAEKTITVQGFPVWFDRDLDSDKKLFSVSSVYSVVCFWYLSSLCWVSRCSTATYIKATRLNPEH